MLLLAGVCVFGGCKSSQPNEEQARPMELSSVENLMPERVQAVFNRSCASCHGHDGHGITGIAPDLRNASRRSASDWLQYFSSSKSPHPGSTTPSTMWMTRDEITAVANFLSHDMERPTEAEPTR